MIVFEDKYFKKFKYSRKQIDKFFDSAAKDLDIARGSGIPEVRFQFSYNSLIKMGIASIACCGYKVSSRTGHHTKILEKLSEILDKEDIFLYGDKMRKARNTELYDGGIVISEKQAGDYLLFVNKTYEEARSFLKHQLGSLL